MTFTSIQSFCADAVLFDMDGTLTDSIAAVEAAWAKVARDIGQDPDFVIASTHGKRAVDNFALFKPHLKNDSEIEREVEKFEESILWFADAYNRRLDDPGLDGTSEYTSITLTPPTSPGTGSHTPALVRSAGGSDVSLPLSRSSSEDEIADALLPRTPGTLLNPSISQRVLNFLNLSNESVNDTFIQPSAYTSADAECRPLFSDDDLALDTVEDDIPMISLQSVDSLKPIQKLSTYVPEAWQLEAASVDRSVRILPGVRKLISSIPDGRYAIATSGAKTYAYGCMKRVGIVPPQVTITADDKRLKAGKPSPDPFILAAECLGVHPSNCVVFEDSPSGIQAGLASGATVIAVCTSHPRDVIEICGAHYVVENMDYVACEYKEGKLWFQVDVV